MMEDLSFMKTRKPNGWLRLSLQCRKANVNELLKLKNILVRRNREYDDLILNSSAKLEASKFPQSKELLINYYEMPPESLKKILIERRRNHGLLHCPSCGNPLEPDTLDHFIPKDDWPEFAIHPNNLIPQCRGCAPIKGARHYCASAQDAMFIHPMYSSSLSKFRFTINVDFSTTTEQIEFDISLTHDKNLDASSVVRVKNHFRELQVKKRIILFCVREINRLKSLLISNSFDIEEFIRVKLKAQSVINQRRDWKTALYLGILSNSDLIVHLKKITPKNHFANAQDEVNTDF